jgi:hypothetical protein
VPTTKSTINGREQLVHHLAGVCVRRAEVLGVPPKGEPEYEDEPDSEGEHREKRHRGPRRSVSICELTCGQLPKDMYPALPHRTFGLHPGANVEKVTSCDSTPSRDVTGSFSLSGGSLGPGFLPVVHDFPQPQTAGVFNLNSRCDARISEPYSSDIRAASASLFNGTGRLLRN